MKLKGVFAYSIFGATILGLAACGNNSTTTTTSANNTTTNSTTTSDNTTTDLFTTTVTTTINPVTTTKETTTVATTTINPVTTTKETTTVATTTINPVTTTKETTTVATTTINTTTLPVATTTDITTSNVDEKTNDASPTIYLAGDSTVKTYEDNQFIGGWGQFLDLFLDDSINVVNAAQGGRSSRSFINEGRLYDIEGDNYSFTQNNGNSIGDVIKEGDFLFVQFGHNDDSTKFDSKPASNYTTVYDRMVPLGTPDSNGIYPVTPAERVSTSALPEAYTSYANDSEEASALNEIKKYGSTYYQYGDGTYKWYLKQYIDFAREKGAIPVLVTPVARVSFNNDGTLKSGPGLHGDDFAYVEAVRQLASEENCLLVDLFSDTKDMLELATVNYANSLMALKPNSLVGEWPSGYDKAYNNSELGCTGLEATHYNKYGAFIEAAMVANTILEIKDQEPTNGEYINFSSKVNETPEEYYDPSNLLPKSTALAIEDLCGAINPTNPNREYKSVDNCISMIDALPEAKDITVDNYLEVLASCEDCFNEYNSINVDDRSKVTNYSKLVEVNNKAKEIETEQRPVASETYKLNPDDMNIASITSSEVIDDVFTIVATEAKSVSVMAQPNSYNFAGETYTKENVISLGGSATYGTSRYVAMTLKANATVTIVAKSGGSDTRTLSVVKSTQTSSVIGQASAEANATVTTLTLTDAGTYYVGSTNKGINIIEIIVEYFN